MAINLSQLSAGTTKATALSNLILVSPQSTVGYQPGFPAGVVGPPLQQKPPSFLFNYEGEQSASLQSDITDHYIEDNTAIQDQISLKPETISTHGFIGELNDIPPFALQLVKTAAEKLTVIGAYAPQLSETALLAYAEAFQLYQVAANAINSAVSAWSSVGNAIDGSNGQSVVGSGGITIESNQNKQQTAFQQWYGYWRTRTLFTVQTPWAVFENMAIQGLRAIQSAETDVITDFEVTFKMIRVASTQSISGATADFLSGRAADQAAPPTNTGINSQSTSSSYSDAIAKTVA